LTSIYDLLLKERKDIDLRERGEKQKEILLLLAKGAVLATVLIAPSTGRLFKKIKWNDSSWQEWKMFNKGYLQRTLRALEKRKMIEVEEQNGVGIVKLTQNGQRQIYRMAVESLIIGKPPKWDGKWRLVFYDVLNNRSSTRDQFRSYLKGAGFYPFQKSVYLHAYPCEKEITFLKHYLGIGSEVRVVLADNIEDDAAFRAFFGV